MPPNDPPRVYAPVGWPGSALPEGAPVENLPITSPYCVDGRCRAFREGFAEDERKTPLKSLLRYGYWTVWFYAIWLLLFTTIYLCRRVHDRLADPRKAQRTTSLNDKITAFIRFWTYRRPNNRVTTKIGLRQVSYGTLALLAFATVFLVILPWPQSEFLRERFRFGSPPLSIRCAMLISALTPLTVALAGKVNIITWMTGVGYDKLNVYHRYVAYMIFCLGTIHTIPHLYAPVKDGGWSMLDKLYENQRRELSGTPLYFAMFGLTFFSIPWIRRRFYEAFKYLHLFFALVYIACFFWHAYGNLCPYYIYATVAVLVFSNFIRLTQRHYNLRSFSNLTGFPTMLTPLHDDITRVVIEVPISFKWKPGQHAFLRVPSLRFFQNHPFSIVNIPSHEKGARVHEMVFLIRGKLGFTKKLFERGDLVKHERKLHGAPTPAKSENTVHINSLTDFAFDFEQSRTAKKEKDVECIEDVDHMAAVDVIEEEPASRMSPYAAIAEWAAADEEALRRQPSVSMFPPGDKITEEKLRFITEKPTGVRSSMQTSTYRASAPTKRRSSACSLPPIDEITQQKLEAIKNKPGIRTPLRIIVDGPYGAYHRPLHKIYDTVLCIAGGCGITACLPHILDLTQCLSTQHKNEVLATRRIHLVWAIRDSEWISWIERELTCIIRNIREYPSPNNVTFTIDVYITRSAALAAGPSPNPSETRLPTSSNEMKLPIAPMSPVSPISPMGEKNVFTAMDVLSAPGGVALPTASPTRPRPALRRLNGGKDIFDSEMDFGVENGQSSVTRGVSVAMHYCRPVIRDVIEGHVGGDRAIVIGCGPSDLSVDIANTVAALQRRVWDGEMREVKLELETFGW